MTVAKFLRLEKCLMVKDIEKLLGLPRATHRYHDFENGKSDALLDKRDKIAEVLGAEVVVLQREIKFENGKILLSSSRSIEKVRASHQRVQSEKAHEASVTST